MQPGRPRLGSHAEPTETRPGAAVPHSFGLVVHSVTVKASWNRAKSWASTSES